jgi:hypothetical protein
MKKMKVGVAILLAALLITVPLGCILGSITGSGNLTTEEKSFSGFTKVEASHGFQLEITSSSTFSIEVTADDNIHQYIDVDKDGDRLRIRMESGRSYRSLILKAKITMPDLYDIELSGGSRADITGFSSSHDLKLELSGGSRVTGDITAGDADFNLSGGSQVDLEGSADDLKVNGSGGSQLDLESFSVGNADLNLSGGSRATVNVTSTLDVNLSGGSRVEYIGEPTLGDIDLSGDSIVSKK